MLSLVSSVIALSVISGQPPPLERMGWLDDKLIPEASGIVKSRRHPGIFWVHNDSGNTPLLFAIEGGGRIVGQFRLAVPNTDWEDIAVDDKGHLYVGDIGNNGGLLPVRAIYRVDEPDPTAPAEKPLPASAVTFYALSKENRFDAESLYYDRGSMVLIAKAYDGREAELFTVPIEPPAPLLRPAQPRLCGRLPGFTEPATGADLSADRRRLAVCSTAVTRVYHRDDLASPSWRLLAVVRYRALPIEGVAWDGNDLRLVAEGGGFYRLAEKTWRAASRSDSSALPSRRRAPRGSNGGKTSDAN
jgi:hypothetical protein